jgi:hypothetical protein
MAKTTDPSSTLTPGDLLRQRLLAPATLSAGEVNQVAARSEGLEHMSSLNREKLAKLKAERSRSGAEFRQDAAGATLKGATAINQGLYGLGEFAYNNNPIKAASELAGLKPRSLDEIVGASSTFESARKDVDDNIYSDISVESERKVGEASALHAAGKAGRVKQLVEEEGYNPTVASVVDEAGSIAESAMNYIDNPTALGNLLLEQIPQLVGGGLSGSIAKALSTKGLTESAKAVSKKTARGKAKDANAGTIGAVLYTGSQEGGSNAVQAEADVMKMTPQELTEKSPEYKELIKVMSHKEAKRQLADMVAAETFVPAALIGAAVSKLSGAGKAEGALFAPKAIKSSIKKAIASGSKDFAGKTIKEAFEESVQGAAGQISTNVAKKRHVDKDTDVLGGVGEAIGTGALAGGLSAGVLSGPGVAVKSTKDAIKAGKDSFVAATKGELDAVAQAKADGIANLLEDPKQSINVKLQGIAERNSVEGVTEEEHTENVEAGMKILVDNMDEIANLGNAIEKTEDDASAKLLQKKHTSLQKQQVEAMKQYKAIQAREKSTVTTEKVQASIESGNSKDFIGSMELSPESIDATDIESFKASTKELTPEVEAKLDAHIELETAIKTMDEVGSDVLNGSVKDKFLGIRNYQAGITSAMSAGNITSANKQLAQLRKFAEGHVDKSTTFVNAFGGDVEAIKRAETEWGKEILPKNRNAKFSAGLVQNVQNESNALNAAVRQAELKINGMPKTKAPVKNAEVIKTPEVNNEKGINEKSLLTSPTTPAEVTQAKPEVTEATTSKELTTASTKLPMRNLVKISNRLDSLEVKEDVAIQDSEYDVKRVDGLRRKAASLAGHLGITENDDLDTLNDKDSSLDEIKEAVRSIVTANEPSRDQGSLFEDSTTTTQEVNKEIDSTPTPVNEKVDSAPIDLPTQSISSETKGVSLASLGFTVKPKRKGDEGNNAALTIEPDLMARLEADPELALKYANKDKVETDDEGNAVLSANQSRAIKSMVGFNNNMIKAFDSLFRHQVANAKRDFIQYMANEEDGSVDANVKSAIAMAAYDWVKTTAGKTLYNDDDDINSIMGRRDGAPITRPLRDLMQKAGSTENSLIDSIGAAAMKSLGIVSDSASPLSNTSNLEQSLGAMGVAMLLESGYLKETLVSAVERANTLPDKELVQLHKDIAKGEASALINSATGKEVMMPFYRAATVTFTEDGKEKEQMDGNVAEVSESNKDTSALFDELFGIQSAATGPTARPNKKVAKNQRKTNMETPAEAVPIIKTHQERAHYIAREKMDKFLALDKPVQLQIMGYSTKTVHISKRAGQEAKNNGIERELQHMIDANEEFGDNPLYFTHEMTKVNRLLMVSNTFNPQNSTTHRHFVSLPEWNATIDKNDKMQMRHFLTAFGESMGVKTDAGTWRGDKNSIGYGVEIIMLMNNPAIQAAADAIYSGEGDPEIFLPHIKEGAYSYDGLLNLGRFRASKGSDTFHTDLVREVDGVTNGPIIGTLNLDAGVNYNDKTTKLARGMLFSDGITESAGLYRGANQDSYEAISESWNGKYRSTVTKLKGDDRLKARVATKIFGKEVERKDSKGGLIQTVYGAADPSIKQGVAYDFIDKFYAQVEKAALADDTVELQKLNNYMDILVPSAKINLAVDPLEQMLSKKQENKLVEYIESTYGESLVESIDESYGDFKEKGGMINTALDIAFQSYSILRDLEIKALQEEMGEDYKITPDDIDVIEEGIYAAQPIMHSFFSKRSGNLKEGLFLGKFIWKRDESDEYLMDQRYLRPPKGREGKKKSTQGRVRVMASPGASPAVLGVQSIDAATMLLYLKEHGALNVYDAIIVGQMNTMEQAKYINKMFMQVQSEYSIMSSAYEAMKRSLDALHNYDPKANLVNKIVMKKKVTKGADGKDIYKEVKLSDFAGKLQNTAIAVDKAKAERIESFTSHSQYHVDGGETIISKPLPSNVPKAIVQEVIKQGVDYKGSSSEGIDLNTFQSDLVQRVSRMEATQVFESLETIGPIRDSYAHRTHLKSLMENVVSKVLEPITLHMEDDNAGETRGMTNGVDTYIINQTSNTTNPVSGLTVHGLRMSTQEVYSHEMVHNVSRDGVDKASPISRRILKLWHVAKRVVPIEAFMNPAIPDTPVERAAAQARWDYIFDIKSKEDGSANFLHEFMAFAMTNARFREELVKHSPNLVGSFEFSLNLLEMLKQVFEEIMDMWHRLTVSKGNADITITDQMDNLFKAASGVNQKNKNAILDQMESATVIGNAKMNGLIIQSKKGVAKILRSPIVQNSKLNTIGAVGEIGALIMEDRGDVVMAGIDKVIDKFSEGQEGLFGALVTELKGRTINNGVFHDLNRIANMSVDQRRNHIKTLVSELSSSMYEGHKDGLTSEQKIAITKMAINTDLSALSAGRSLKDLQRLVKSDAELNKEIDRLTLDLDQFKAHRHFYSRMAENLGHFMVKGTAIEAHTLMNAKQISEVWVEGKGTPIWAKKAEPIIDQLASLYAIKYSERAYRNQFSDVMLTELANNNLKNGVSFTLSMNENIKKDAEKRLFVGHNAMIKGYKKETLNPNIAVEYGTAADEAEMNRMGFFKPENSKALEKDASDPNKNTPVFMYVNRHGGRSRFVSGTISKTGKVHKGANTFTTRNQVGDPTPGITGILDIQQTKVDKAPLLAEIFLNPKARDPKAKYSIPVMNNVGTVIGYRYMMDEQLKDTFMEKDNEFDTVMGSTAASVEDKVASKDINEQTIEALKEQYDADYASGSRGFVEIGPNSNDKKLREMYYMLPDEARRHMKQVWGSETMHVKRESVNLIFGYRKFSITDVWHDDPAELNTMQNLYIQSMDQIFKMWGGSAYSGIKSIESGWQEIIKDIKDIIVIKTGVVTAVNTLSNTISLRMLGVPMTDIIRDQAEAFRGAVEYQKDTKEVHSLEAILANDQRPNRRTLDQQRIAELKNRIHKNPVRELVESGVYQTIVEDIDTSEGQFTYKSQFSEKVGNLTEPLTSKLHPNIKTVAKNMYMTHDSKTYKMLNQAAVLSDFTARYALHKHYTTRTEDQLSSKDSIAKVVSIFIDYDLPTHQGMQYANDMGLVWFSKYNFRLQKILMETLRENPARVLMLLALQSSMGNVPTMFDNSVFTHDMTSMVRNPMDNLDAMGQIGTVQLATGAF